MQENKKYAIIYVVWGGKYLQQLLDRIMGNSHISRYDVYIITDTDLPIDNEIQENISVITIRFETEGLLRKTVLFDNMPEGYDAYLYLDTDTIILEDVTLGFEKAEKHGIAMAPAPHYSLDHFWGFNNVMNSLGHACRGQLQYNTGVIFFSLSPSVSDVFRLWQKLAHDNRSLCSNDQPYFSLAMEMLEFNPYTLSISYNYRGFGDAISGMVRIWHSHAGVPIDINIFDRAWPPRRVLSGKMVYPDE